MLKINGVLNVGVIGLGVGEAHIKSYNKIDNCNVKSVCDFNKTRRENICKSYDISSSFEDYRKITEDPDIDIVSICSYDNFHFEHVMSAIKNGKSVMVEKPAVLFPSEAEKVLKALENSKVFISSNLILRQSPRFIYIKEMCDNGEFGDIFHIEGDYLHHILEKITEGWRGKMDFYCTVYGGGIHLIDLMRWILDTEVLDVCAMGSSVSTKNTQYKRDETITALLKWRNGATGKCTTSFAPKRTKFHSLNIYGTKKTFINDLPKGRIYKSDNPQHKCIEIHQSYPGTEKGDLLPEFVNNVRNGKKPMINEKDIFNVMSVCFAISESLSKKKTVKVNNFL